MLVQIRWKDPIFFSRLNAPTEEDKSWHRFNRNVLVLCHDLISCHPSPLVIPGPPHCATTASGDNSRGYGLTGGSPCTAALKERCTCPGPGCSVAFKRERGWELSCFSSADGVLPGPRCSEMESMPFPVPLDAEWLWEVVSCSLAIDSMTWDFTTKAWTRAGSLRADREMCLPLVFTLTRGLCRTDVSASPKSHLLDPEITFPQPRLSFTLCYPWVWLLSRQFTELVFFFLFFFYWYSYGLPVCGSQPIQLPLHGWHGWEFSLMCCKLFTVTVGWKVKAQSKHRPLAGPEMTAQRARPSWMPRPPGSSRRQNHHMPFICWKN